MTATVARITLAPREHQILEGLAGGNTLAAVALDLNLRESTALGYLRLAKRKLRGVSETPAAIAVGYATGALTPPQLLDPEGLFFPREQRDIVTLTAQGRTSAQMAAELQRPVAIVRRDGRELLANLRVRNRAHAITRAWQYQILTTDQVLAWLPSREAEHRTHQGPGPVGR